MRAVLRCSVNLMFWLSVIWIFNKVGIGISTTLAISNTGESRNLVGPPHFGSRYYNNNKNYDKSVNEQNSDENHTAQHLDATHTFMKSKAMLTYIVSAAVRVYYGVLEAVSHWSPGLQGKALIRDSVGSPPTADNISLPIVPTIISLHIITWSLECENCTALQACWW